MILGVLSDTHGNVSRTTRALDILRRAGAEAFIHCGDIGGELVLDEFIGLRAWLVWGNCDEFSTRMKRYAAELGLKTADAPPLQLDLDGARLIACHGHEREFEKLLALHLDPSRDVRKADMPEADYILHGHTHMARDERLMSGARLINPGALHRTGVCSVATIDLKADDVRFWVVEDDAPSDAPLKPYAPWR